MKIRNSTAEFLIFSNQKGKDGIKVRFENETIWLSQKLMAILFDCSTDNISFHLKNIFKSGEVDENSVVEEFSVTASDGKNYKTKHYSLDAIISVGHRVNSKRATQFRQWATSVLISEEIVQVIDILEQIKDVSRMIEIHENDDDNLVLDQFKYRKEKFLKDLKSLLQQFNISPTDLAAA